MRSIRRRLLISLLGLWTTVWLAIALITLDRSGHEVAELLDAQLAQTAQVLRQIALAGNLPDRASSPQTLSPVGHPYESKIGFQLWRGQELIGTFGAAPAGALARMQGFSDQEIADARWRVFGLPTGQPEEILYVAQSYAIRQELIGFLTIQALAPVLWSLPVTVLLIWFAVADGLRPLQRLAVDIGHRSADLLTPVDEHAVPIEIQPLINAFNGLMEQLKQAFSVERRFIADASHELRTPLAAIRTHAQVAQRSKDPGEHAEAIDQLIRGVDRATHLVSRLLTLARLEPGATQIEHGAWSLTETVARVVEDQQAAARAKSIELTQEVPDADPCVVTVHPSMLGVLVGNLVDNAIKYTPDGGRIRIAVASYGERAVLQVSDSGPGIPAADRGRVFERFYRPAGQSTPGAGLGLSIVQRICELQGAQIELLDREDGPGLLVKVTFRTPTSQIS